MAYNSNLGVFLTQNLASKYQLREIAVNNLCLKLFREITLN